MTLEAGLTAITTPMTFLIGGYPTNGGVTGYDGYPLRPARGEMIEGIDDLAEIEMDGDGDGAGDGEAAGRLRLSSRAITFPHCGPADGQTLEAFTADIHALRTVMSPLPCRSGPGSTRLFRWKLEGEIAKRIAYRPAVGKALLIPTDEKRLLWGRGSRLLRLDCPNPVIVSDEYHSLTFTAGQTRTITNAGSLASMSWWLVDAPSQTVIENLDHDEYIRFPRGPVTTTVDRGIFGPDAAYGVAYGPGNTQLAQWPLLRPGDNTIRASKACTLYWRDTF